ncbi:zinc-ribbon domain-containing protein [Myxococcus sp. RHSTA-1-4]|uniref:zinc-ribbon domain-containing protein n=1 Tax=Myxococcus sp. RHSTA-1-4 TaxID=2874601 RepID=UPI001CBD53F4|nr:zinc-ribbon domain-containing protein [Myxococcus sp. RHSTA-1-4]MBZ4415847.1 zinc-ribbon domain-containing protein [Myxococcus sp. RHSTA-1-4]
MRIVCQKCAAAYAIDDRLITAKGVRAQCPRCRHLQLVRRDPSAAPAAGAPAPSSQPAAPATQPPQPQAAPAAPALPAEGDLFGDFGSPPPTAAPPVPPPAANRPSQGAARPAQAAAAPASDLFGDFGAMPSPGPASAPPVDPFASLDAPAPAAPGADPLLDFLGPAPAAPPAPVARVSSGPGAAPVPVTPPTAASTPRAAPPATAATAPLASSRPATSGCRSCGKPLTDSFDQALGMCDDCRQREPARAPAAAAASAPVAAASGGADFLPPLTSLEEGASPSLSPEPRGGPRASAAPGLGAEPRSSPRIPISTDIIPDMGPEPRSGARTAPSLGAEPRSGSSRISGVPGPRTGSAQIQAAGRASSGRGRGLLLGGLVLLLIGGGAGGFILFQRHQEQARRNAQPPAPPPVPGEIQAVLSRWKLKYLELSGSSAERLAEGQKQLASDDRFAYAEAEESFQQALLLDPRSDAAIAGYVQALALGRGAGLDDATFQEARTLMEAAEARSGRTAPLLLAHANLLLTRSRQSDPLEQARKLAEELLGLSEVPDVQKAEAHLILGRAYLSTSSELARNHFDTAQQLAPDLKRVPYYRALAHESAGEYSAALDTLRKRLAANPQDWDSLAATSRIYQEVGEPSEARRLYEARVKADAGELRALLPLAMLRYQTEGNAAAAVRELRALLKNRSEYENPEVAEALVHLAAAERAVGNADAGAKAAEEALRLVKGLPEAHLQVFLVALGRRDATKAREHFSGLRGRLEDAALEKVLEGRLLLLEKKPAEALERFQEAVRLDGRRLDAQLLAGVAAASAKRREDAFRALNPALQSDPLRLEPRPAVTRFWLRPAETVEGMEGIILALAEGPEDPSPLLYEGLLRFHQGALDAAERHFRDVLEVDSNNGAAQAYRSLIALKRGNTSEARSLGQQAVEGGRQMPVAHLSLGLALAEARQVEPAKRALRDALTLAPGLLSAQVRLAELEPPQRRAAARDTLVKVVGLDPAYLPAKRMLYQLER